MTPLRRALCRLLGLATLDELIAARAEAELLRVQLELAEAALAMVQAQLRYATPVASVLRVERRKDGLN